MSQSSMTPQITPKITIVVSPRERFSHTRASLESLYEHTQMPFELIYVDGGSPKSIQSYLQDQAQTRNFELIRTEHYLSPNQARNLAIPKIKTEYVLFIDNDVEVSPGWLEQLFNCAQDTDATVVCPLTCIGQPLHQTIHLAGGEARILIETQDDGSTKRKVHEKHYFVNRPVAEVADKLQRQQCEFAEFHCMLVKTSIFADLGLLDEKLLSTREHIDFCMSVTLAGGTIFCEPASVVTYVPELPWNWADISFFLLRWSDAWEVESLQHFCEKWQLSRQDKYFKKRYKRLGHRRYHAFLKPLVRRLSLGTNNTWLEQLAIPVERSLNRFISSRHTQTYLQEPVSNQQ
jgi:GT2 family glycosyltransferase